MAESPPVEGSSVPGRSSSRSGSPTVDGGPSAAENRLRQEREQYRNLRVSMEKRRDDFRVYLDQSGVMDKLSKVLLRMFEEPLLPADPIAYFKKLVVDDMYLPDVEELDRLSREIKELKAEIAGLTDENKKLRSSLGMPLDLILPTAMRPTPSEDEPIDDPSAAAKDAAAAVSAKENVSKESGAAAKDKKKK
ncbi:hypothetical protein BV898_12306 [Hypsibius exemplaris]|uniref:c-Myc-binding protein n=1 Tax=Hypsibius exemplaris TaxID=2072580 RepID=A0A1W0WE23_HYPEX|nr:hypothetical protein BV898_12306 [Hypsibius exemplaris]